MKKIVISIIAILTVVAVANTTFATSVLDDLNELKTNNNTTIKENQTPEEIESGELENQNKNQNLSTDGVNSNKNAPTTTPYTGIEDYSSAIFIVIFAASAIYAYKKIRDYKE